MRTETANDMLVSIKFDAAFQGCAQGGKNQEAWHGSTVQENLEIFEKQVNKSSGRASIHSEWYDNWY